MLVLAARRRYVLARGEAYLFDQGASTHGG
jgi:hypothetical protein